jgi:hypothetical protein
MVHLLYLFFSPAVRTLKLDSVRFRHAHVGENAFRNAKVEAWKMLLFHRTDMADKIIDEGFRSSSERRPNGDHLSGVWLSERPLNHDECDASRLLAIEVPDDVAREHEVRDGKEEYREFCIPAEMLNRYGPPRLLV